MKLCVEVSHYMLDSGVILESITTQILAITTSLVTAMRHLSDQRNMAVDPDATKVESLGQAHRATVVTGPDR